LKFELLTLTMPTRKNYLSRLMQGFSVQRSGHRYDFAHRIRMCDPTYTLGENRDMLLRASQGEYVAWFDDDDWPNSHYLQEVMPLLDGVDYVGFDVQCYIDDIPMDRVTHHSLKYGGWYEDGTGFYRDISHINPMRRELALLEPFEGGHGEDVRWAERMRKRSVLKTEHTIERVMYHYYFRTKKNQAEPCSNCQSESTVLVEHGSWCNACGVLFEVHPVRKSCLWS
jgi:Glycosyl transferase family 2